MPWALPLVAATAMLLASSPLVLASDQAHQAAWKRDVAPFLQQHCISCHGPEKQKGKVRLDGPMPDLRDHAQAELWLGLKRLVAQGDMPPEKEPRPSSDSMVALFSWIDDAAGRAAVASRGGIGRRALRRLTREEYVATVLDALGLSFPHAAIDLVGRLPAETVANSFANDSNLQTTQPLQLRRSLDLAQDLLDVALPRPGTIQPLRYEMDLRTIVTQARAKFDALPPDAQAHLVKRGKAGPQIADFEVPAGIDGGKAAKLTAFGLRPEQIDAARGVLLGPNPMVNGGSVQGLTLVLPLVPERGVLRLRAVAGAALAPGDGAPRMRLSLAEDTRTLNGANVLFPAVEITVAAPADQPAEHVLDVPLALVAADWAGLRRTGTMRVQIDNPAALVAATPLPADLPKGAKPQPPERSMLVLRSFSIEVLPTETWPTGAEAVLAARAGEDDTARARRVLGRLLERAFRRPPREQELARFLERFQTLRSGGADAATALKAVAAAALISPQTWYLLETKGAERQRLDAWELASRLSYLLTNGPPDEELRARAADGKLLADDELRRQVARLVTDARAIEACRQFARQWLELDVLAHLDLRFADAKVVDSRTDLAWYERAVRADLADEPAQTLLDLLHGDRPVAELAASQHVVVNDRLARVYGIDGVVGPAWRRVAAPADRRCGLLTLASCIAAATHGQKRGEIKRGVYVIERFFGIDIPSPPGNVDVKPLDIQLAENKNLGKVTPRKHVEQHISNPTCAVCHRRSDPLGFAWDAYDNRGLLRRENDGKPIAADTSGKLPDGSAFADLAALSAHLATAGSPFAIAFAERLYAYALGRGLDHGDGAHLALIRAAAAKEGGGLRALLTAMVLSEPFRTK